MVTREVTLCGKPVTLAYCYATEIAYKSLSDEPIVDYIKEVIDCVKQGKDPDVMNTTKAIIACMLAYYDYKGQEMPVKDSEITHEATASELAVIIIAIVEMRMEFYKIPKGEPADPKPTDEEENSEKN